MLSHRDLWFARPLSDPNAVIARNNRTPACNVHKPLKQADLLCGPLEEICTLSLAMCSREACDLQSQVPHGHWKLMHQCKQNRIKSSPNGLILLLSSSLTPKAVRQTVQTLVCCSLLNSVQALTGTPFSIASWTLADLTYTLSFLDSFSLSRQKC